MGYFQIIASNLSKGYDVSFFNRVKTSAAINRKSEELLYTIVAEEMGNGERNGGLWLKALEQASGNEERRIAEYIKLRIRALKDDVHLMKEILKDATLLEDSKVVKAIPKAKKIVKEVEFSPKIEKAINEIESSPIIKEPSTTKHWSEVERTGADSFHWAEVEQQEEEIELEKGHEVLSKSAKETIKNNRANLQQEPTSQWKCAKASRSNEQVIKDDFNLKYMSILSFSRIMNVSEEKVIQLINKEYYDGIVIDDKWFIDRDEIGKEQPEGG